MKRILFVITMAAAGVVASATPSQAQCTPTGYIRDGRNLTAALVNPRMTVSGDVDATGCDIGVYYGPNRTGQVNEASIHDADYYGVVNNGGNVRITDSTIYDISSVTSPNAQQSVGIYFVKDSESTGEIRGNVLWNYQKGGIVVNGTRGRVLIFDNTVIGQGPVGYVVQNGIQVGYDSDADVTGNLVVDHSYNGPNNESAAGFLVAGGDCYLGPLAREVRVTNNVGVNNDVGVYLANLDAGCEPPDTPTRNVASHNILRNNQVNNSDQAGIRVEGNRDVIENNRICGAGYTPPGGVAIDTTMAIRPTVRRNRSCRAEGPVTGQSGGATFARVLGQASPVQ
jgi:hypothetical protein